MKEEIQIWNNLPSVYSIDGHLATINLIPGQQVYGEKLVDYEDKELRLWNPRRSKLAAALLNGLERFPFQENSRILYLGASTGTTPSHISDISPDGMIYCVEFSPRMMRKLVDLTLIRSNLIPLLDDATKPRNYMHLVENVDVLYSDVAQPNQIEIFTENMRLFLKEGGTGILMLKARSIDVTRNPKDIFQEAESRLKTGGFRVVEKIDLEPYEKDHMAFICEIGF